MIEDPSSEKSAVSLSVGVGSLNGPKSHEGLPHFLEHMLFLGTAKYPEAGEYSEYLAQHGGSSNAYTAETLTNYHFEVSHSALTGALDRFS